MSKKISSFQLIKNLLEEAAAKDPSAKDCSAKLSREEVQILKEATGVDFLDTLGKIGALKD